MLVRLKKNRETCKGRYLVQGRPVTTGEFSEFDLTEEELAEVERQNACFIEMGDNSTPTGHQHSEAPPKVSKPKKRKKSKESASE